MQGQVTTTPTRPTNRLVIKVNPSIAKRDRQAGTASRNSVR